MAKMLMISPEFNCSKEILTIVAMLSGELPTLDSYRTLDAHTVYSPQRVAQATKPGQGG